MSRGIESLSLSIRSGEAFGLLGLNGSGKTTTFKLALGLLRPTSGEIRVMGVPPLDARGHAAIGYLPELPYLYPFLTPRESLRFYGRLSRLPEPALPGRIDEVLELVGLSASEERKMGGFSKGMLQRVGLAQSILHSPKLLMLDEPVSGLDPLAIKQFRVLLSDLNQKGMTMILSSHSISEVEKLCHRVGILKEGRLIKILSQSEWSAGGGLESLFVSAIS